MADAGWELQKALFALLAADTPLNILLGGPAIYDRAPPNADFPYLTFAGASATDWSTQTTRGQDHDVIIDVWSRDRGRGEALEIAAAIDTAISAASLTLAGHTLVNLTYQQTDIALDEDGETFHAVLSYRAVTETQ